MLHVAYRDLKKYDGEPKLLTISEMQQISGRAGRKGMDITGEAVILAGIRNEQRRKDAEYLIKVGFLTSKAGQVWEAAACKPDLRHI